MHLEVRLALLDIEGTVSPLAFVRDSMFPYAAARYSHYLSTHWQDPACLGAVALLRTDAAAENPPLHADDIVTAIACCQKLAANDRKATGLKAIQGLIWDEGFASGDLKPPLFDDVEPALATWKKAGARLAIYSSGSAHAQQQFFRHTTAGDLSGCIEAYFDTTIGPKRESTSYAAIANRLQLSAEKIAFFSDLVVELDAARQAGMVAVLVQRPGNTPQPPWDGPVLTSLASLTLTP